MQPTRTHLDSAAPTAPDPLRLREELVAVRCGAWRLLVPMRHVARVLGAALPALAPGGDAAPTVAVGSELLEVIFGEALLGAAEVALRGGDQMLLLEAGGRRALLWVSAVEEVVEHRPVEPPAGAAAPAGLLAGWSAADRPLAVLDVPRMLARAA